MKIRYESSKSNNEDEAEADDLELTAAGTARPGPGRPGRPWGPWRPWGTWRPWGPSRSPGPPVPPAPRSRCF